MHFENGFTFILVLLIMREKVGDIMYLLNRRGILITRYLINTEKPISSEVLASILGTTSRTIRNDIEMIDQILSGVGANVVSKSGSGYMIEIHDENEFHIFVDSFNEKYNDDTSIPQYNVERIRSMIHQLLITEGSIKSEIFMEQFFISRTTLSQDLKYIRKLLSRYHLEIKQRPNYGLSIVGKEHHLRTALIDYLFIDEDMSSMGDHEMKLRLDIKGCQDAMQYLLLKTSIHISFQSLKEIANLISVSDYRRCNNHYVEFDEMTLDELCRLEEYPVAIKIYKELNIETNVSEIIFLALWIASRRIYGLEDEFSLVENKSLFFLSDEMLKFLFVYTDVNFLSDQDVRYLVTRELRGMLLRITYGLEMKNMPMIEIKQMNPAFEYAILMCDYLNKKYAYVFSEEEISNLAILLHRSMSKYNVNYKKQRICLVFHRGQHSARIIYNQLKNNFDRYIESIGSCEYHELNRNIDSKYDLIITDMPRVKFTCQIPVHQIQNKFNVAERAKLKSLLLHRSQEFEHFIRCFHENLIFKELDAQNKNEVLSLMCGAMNQHYQVSETLFDAVIARENISSTERSNNVSLAHSLFPVAEKTCVSLAILKKPILWNQEQVQLVICVANGKDEDYVFMVITLLQIILDDVFLIHNLLKLSDYQELKQLFYEKIMSDL